MPAKRERGVGQREKEREKERGKEREKERERARESFCVGVFVLVCCDCVTASSSWTVCPQRGREREKARVCE